MTFLAPLWLGVAALAALGIAALHFITTRRPPAAPLPTARFVPAGEAQSAARAARPADLRLLALRVAAVMLLGAAFARPVRRAHGGALTRVIVVDASRSARADTRDSSLAQWRAGDAVVVFDSVARIISGSVPDTLRALGGAAARGTLSAGLVAARRAGAALARSVDSLELVVVSPITDDELDAATAPLLGDWPGRVRIVRTRAATAARSVATITSTDPDDPLRPAVAAANAMAGAADRAPEGARDVRVLRAVPNSADSAAARSGAAVVYWPAAPREVPAALGLATNSVTIAAPFIRMPVPVSGKVQARWADGTPAAVESSIGSGCLRTVGIGVVPAGDIAVDPAFLAAAHDLLGPCDGVNIARAAPDSMVATWRAAAVRSSGGAPAAASARNSPREASGASSPLAPWLLAAGLALLAAELFARRSLAVRPA